MSRTLATWLDIMGEAVAGIAQRPARMIMTMLGTLLGVGAFTVTLGLAATAQGQVDQQFNALTATQVTVNDVGSAGGQASPVSFPPAADQRVDHLDGVVAAGVSWPISGGDITITNHPITGQPIPPAVGLQLEAADPGALRAMGGHVLVGRLYDQFFERGSRPVAILGQLAAERLGITQLQAMPAVFVDGDAYTVIGIAGGFARSPQGALSVFIPTTSAQRQFGDPVNPRATMQIVTRLGAAQVVAREVPLALRPDEPDLFRVVTASSPTVIQGQVNHALNGLLLVLAAIMLAIGAVGIANTTLVAVLERTPEIGLRRALGARPAAIAGQFLMESAATGAVGGILGTAGGVVIVLVAAVTQREAAVLPTWAVLPALATGGAVGLLAGIYPALRAARIEPVAALER